MTAAANAVKVVRTAILGMNAAMLANPIGLIVALIAGLVVAFVYLWNNVEGFRKFWINAWKKIKSKFSSIGTSLGKSMGGAVKSAMNKVISTIQSSINKGIGFINSAIRLANKLPGINVGTVPKISLPRLAKGGVLEKGQVGLLEGSGAEAVVPLERNKAWLSRVAEDLNELQSRDSYNGNEITALLNRTVDLLEDISRMKIYLDSGAMVGELVPAIDGRLSDRLTHVMRGNTR